jgi:hypothetical protein
MDGIIQKAHGGFLGGKPFLMFRIVKGDTTGGAGEIFLSIGGCGTSQDDD